MIRLGNYPAQENNVKPMEKKYAKYMLTNTIRTD
jgi:hypothetical protein